MKDDSLSDVVSTVKGLCGVIHPNFKDWQTCPKCRIIDDANSVGIKARPTGSLNVYANEVWNEAIEAAAKIADKDTRTDQAGYEFGPAIEIRKLKK